MSTLAAPYIPRRPQETALFRLVKEHLDDFIEHARESYEAPLPKYVVDEFRRYILCGDFREGFVMTVCCDCHHALLVPFSCKTRCACPSCGGRRMAESAARLVENVVTRCTSWIGSVSWSYFRSWVDVCPALPRRSTRSGR